jgi:beta-lactamase superfamily II metal-dependent hydrolase
LTPDSGHLRIELLPAQHGDALLLQWGDPADGHALLIDGGPAGAYAGLTERLAKVRDHGGLDLLVLTHIDADHIEGLLLVCNDAALALPIDEVWFNGYGQLRDDRGALQGEMLTALVTARDLPLNARFGQRAVCTRADQPLDPVTLDGGLVLTVLGPDRSTLDALLDAWKDTLDEAGLDFESTHDALDLLRGRKRLVPAESYLSDEDELDIHDLAVRTTPRDYSLPNRSSIVLLAEYGKARVLLAGDATPGVLVPACRRLLAERPDLELPLSAVKLPHHGSAANMTSELVGLLPAWHYLVSSDGSRFGHPDDVAIARVLEFGPRELELVFNYRSSQTQKWEAVIAANQGYAASTRYPPRRDTAGIALTFSGRTGLAT